MSGERGPLLFCLVAGGGDVATGLLLLAAPELMLRLLGIERPEGSLELFRFVGVFVASVGTAYLYPWLRGGTGQRHRLATAIEITAGIRIAVAAFLVCAVALREMGSPWLTVGTYDALVAAAQLALLARGFFGRAS